MESQFIVFSYYLNIVTYKRNLEKKMEERSNVNELMLTLLDSRPGD